VRSIKATKLGVASQVLSSGPLRSRNVLDDLKMPVDTFPLAGYESGSGGGGVA